MNFWKPAVRETSYNSSSETYTLQKGGTTNKSGCSFETEGASSSRTRAAAGRSERAPIVHSRVVLFFSFFLVYFYGGQHREGCQTTWGTARCRTRVGVCALASCDRHAGRRNILGSALMTSARKISNRGPQIPEPLLVFTSKCPFKVQISQGLGPLFQIETFWELAVQCNTLQCKSGTLFAREHAGSLLNARRRIAVAVCRAKTLGGSTSRGLQRQTSHSIFLRVNKGVPRKGVWTSVNMRVWTCNELGVKHDRTSCYLRPPFLGTPLVPSRAIS